MTDLAAAEQKARRLRELHHAGEPLILVNAWDVASARIVETLGFPAVATSSAGVANSLGYSDQENIPRDEMLAAVRRIAKAIRVPLSADLEAGYDHSESGVAETISELIDAGGVGCNIEDGAHDADHPFLDTKVQSRRIATARRAADESGVPVVINARTDILLANPGVTEAKIEEVLSRADAYVRAGADCIFVPGVTDAAIIERLVRSIAAPLNILAFAATPPVSELQRIGVKRISLGSSPMAYAMAQLRNAALEVKQHGTFSFTDSRIPYAELNALF
ncbi:MAG: isocitrate lyase/phosphoenolpyruvate mutase family protein [Candidatus Eremiobacteraeota bacterium]|nr:isocitrate lyase/phosphoenolpyruvate mutase family protein [Candidatus Eremiobacteraeota bacterium]